MSVETGRERGDYSGLVICGGCHDAVPGNAFLTEVNPPGGYGRPQMLVCDRCMGSERWAWWRSQNWPNWPEESVAILPAPALPAG